VPAARNCSGAKRAQPRGFWSSSIATRVPSWTSVSSREVMASARMRSNGEASTSWRQISRVGAAASTRV
jgi:hypothetical protein